MNQKVRQELNLLRTIGLPENFIHRAAALQQTLIFLTKQDRRVSIKELEVISNIQESIIRYCFEQNMLGAFKLSRNTFQRSLKLLR